MNIKCHQSIGNIPHFQKSFEMWGNLNSKWMDQASKYVKIVHVFALSLFIVSKCFSQNGKPYKSFILKNIYDLLT